MKATSQSLTLATGVAFFWLPTTVAAMGDSADALVYGGPEELAEFSVAIHPETPTTILVAGMRFVGAAQNPPFDIAAFVSTDAGATWNVTPSVTNDPVDDYADPIVTWAKSGSTWMAVVCFITANTPKAVHVARSADLGDTWQDSEVFGEWETDKSYVAAGGGAMFAAWVRNVGTRRIYVKRSTDQGATWPGDPTVLGEDPGTDYHHEPSIALGPNGEVYVAWAVLEGGRR